MKFKPKKKLSDRPVKDAVKKLHETLEYKGDYNVYVITEDVNTGGIFMYVETSKGEVSKEEEKSFLRLIENIRPYILKRSEVFKEKWAQDPTL